MENATLRKTAKSTTFEEYRKACTYYENGVFFHYCNGRLILAKNKHKKSLCKLCCPRFKLWMETNKG